MTLVYCVLCVTLFLEVVMFEVFYFDEDTQAWKFVEAFLDEQHALDFTDACVGYQRTCTAKVVDIVTGEETILKFDQA